MKGAALLLIFLVNSGFVLSQNNSDNKAIEQEVNEQLWKPFKEAFESRDWKKFNDLHTDDVLRVSKWSGIRLGSEYKEANIRSFQKKEAPKRIIDFWFEHRIYGDNIGYEVGYYRIKSELPDKSIKMSYARFHIVMKRIDGKWKIAQDWDINNINGVTVTSEDFAKRTPLKL